MSDMSESLSPEQALLDALEEIRLKEGLNDAQFARSLQVHRDMWSKTKLGKAEIGWKVCRGALRRYGAKYGHLKDLVYAYMAGGQEGVPEPQRVAV
jgi:hypothetical protein